MWSVWQTCRTGRRAAGFLGGLLVALLLAAAPAAGDFVEPINLSNSAAVSVRPGLAVNGAGQVFVAWKDGPDILFTRSRPTQGSCTGPGRLEFETPVSLSAGTGTASVAAVAANDSGGVFVAWQAVQLPASSEIWLRRSTDGGQNFLPAVNLSQSDGPSTFPSVAADNGGGVYVAWGDGSLPATPSQPEILFKRSTDFGATFEAFAILSQTPQTNSRSASLATDGSNVLLAWQDGASILYKKFGRLDLLTAVASSTAMNLSTGLAGASSPSLAFGDGRISVAFVTSNGPSVYHRWSSDGTTFSAPENLSGAVVSPSDSRAARRNGSAMVAWSEMLDPTTGNTEIRYRLPGSMGSPETVWSTPTRSVTPATAMDSTGRLLVAWQETVNGNDEILLSYSGGTGGSTMMPATVWAAPRVLNYRTVGRGTGEQPNFTVFIELPDGSAGEIDLTSVKLNGQSAMPAPSALGDANGNGIPDLMVKFNRDVFNGAELTAAQRDGNYTVAGNTRSGGCFSGGSAVQIMR